MNSRRRATWFVVGVCLSLAAMALFWPASPPGSRVVERRDGVDALMAAARRKLALKNEVIDGLIAGDLTVAAAVDRCEEIEREVPELALGFRQALEAAYPGRPFRECLARNIVAHCESRLRELPDPADGVLARLHAELAELTRTRH